MQPIKDELFITACMELPIPCVTCTYSFYLKQVLVKYSTYKVPMQLKDE